MAKPCCCSCSLRSVGQSDRREEVRRVAARLDWCAAGHITLLIYRQYRDLLTIVLVTFRCLTRLQGVLKFPGQMIFYVLFFWFWTPHFRANSSHPGWGSGVKRRRKKGYFFPRSSYQIELNLFQNLTSQAKHLVFYQYCNYDLFMLIYFLRIVDNRKKLFVEDKPEQEKRSRIFEDSYKLNEKKLDKYIYTQREMVEARRGSIEQARPPSSSFAQQLASHHLH